jgi:hypothetical protein
MVKATKRRTTKRRTTKRRTTKRSAKSSVYKVVASYTGTFERARDAKAAQEKLKNNAGTQVTPVRKTSKGYSFVAKISFITSNKNERDQAVKIAKAQGARVSVSTFRPY